MTKKKSRTGTKIGLYLVYIVISIFFLYPVLWVLSYSFKTVSYTHLDVYKRQHSAGQYNQHGQDGEHHIPHEHSLSAVIPVSYTHLPSRKK